MDAVNWVCDDAVDELVWVSGADHIVAGSRSYWKPCNMTLKSRPQFSGDWVNAVVRCLTVVTVTMTWGLRTNETLTDFWLWVLPFVNVKV